MQCLMVSSILELNNVTKTYSTAAGEFTALKGINLKVGAGEFLGIVEESGADKSTLLNTERSLSARDE